MLKRHIKLQVGNFAVKRRNIGVIGDSTLQTISKECCDKFSGIARISQLVEGEGLAEIWGKAPSYWSLSGSGVKPPSPEAGVWGKTPHHRRLRSVGKASLLEARGFGGEALSAGRFLQYFNKNNAFLCIFWPKYLF